MPDHEAVVSSRSRRPKMSPSVSTSPPGWVREYARRGEIPSLKLGRYRRFDSAQVDAWLTARKNGTSA